MFNFFKQDKEKVPQDVKALRERLLQFIKEQLQKAEGGEGANIRGLQLFLSPAAEERHLYESAVYFEEEERFKKEEVQRIADDYALGLPEGWTLDIHFVEALPGEAIKMSDLPAGLFIATRKRTLKKIETARITVLNGEAEQEVYTISSESGKVNIGREKKVQAGDGFYRINTIAFPADSTHESNKFISRQHAHIEWDSEAGVFLLFADEGGLPPRNKVKVRSEGETPVKLQSDKIGYQLKSGDQIILGETALLEFRYENSGTENQ